MSSSVRIVVRGSILAHGGAGGDGAPASPSQRASGGGGGSGGVIYLAAPALEVTGELDAGPGAAGRRGGAGGLGRIRLSTVPERCVLFGRYDPPLVDGCAPTGAQPGRTFIDLYPL